MNSSQRAQAEAILRERFGRDTLLALATVKAGIPSVRTVDAYYEDGAFYVITYALSGKMRAIAETPVVAVSGEWFSGHGIGENLGWFCRAENAAMAEKLRQVFGAWIDNGHNDFTDPNTILLRVRLTDGVLFAQGERYDIDFSAATC